MHYVILNGDNPHLDLIEIDRLNKTRDKCITYKASYHIHLQIMYFHD